MKPAFTAATGAGFSGTGNASGTLSSDIAAGEISPNVFESVGGDNITPLEPKFTKWYIQYAGTSMVVAYNPKSKYASQFKAIADGSKPVCDLYTLLQTPGLKLGRTDPNIDPQGRDFIYMLELAQSYCHLPSDTVAKILGTTDFGTLKSSEIYAESALDSTLQSGQLDAASAFITQAIELQLNYIRCRSRSTWAAPHMADQYKTATVTPTDGRPRRLAAGHRHHDYRHADAGRRGVRRPTRCRRPAWRSTSRAGSRCSRRRSGASSAVPATIRVSWAASPAAARRMSGTPAGATRTSPVGGRAWPAAPRVRPSRRSPRWSGRR